MPMKKLLILFLCLLLSLPAVSLAEEEKVLNLFTWELYVDDQTIADFEQATGIQIRYATFDSNESMLAKLQLSGEAYDVIIASDFVINIARKAGLLQKLDHSLLPHAAGLSPAMLNQYFDPDNEYTIPYVAGTPLIVYNPDYVDIEITGYESLWDESLRDSVVVMDDARNIVGITLKTMGQSFNVTDDALLAQAAERLAALRPNIRAFNSDTPYVDLLSGECAVAYMFTPYAVMALEENPDLRIVYPKEGVGFGIDAAFIPANAPHPENAHRFLDFLLQPAIAAQVAEAQLFVCPVQAAYEYIPEALQTNPAIHVPDALLENAEFIMDVGEYETKFQNIWTDFKLLGK